MTATGCMMRACLALCVAAALVGAARAHCDGCLDGECYRKHRLPVAPGMYNWALDVNRHTNTVYIHTDYQETLVQCQLDTDLCNTMTNTQEIYGLTVDQRTGDTYGIIIDDNFDRNLYKFDLVNNEKKLLVRGRVHYMTYKDKLYYSISSRGIFTYEDGESRVVAGSEGYYGTIFVIDKHDDIYFRIFSRDTDNFIIKNLRKTIDNRTVQWDGDHVTVDRDGNAVLFHLDSHSVYRVTNGQATEVGAINDAMYYYFERPLFDRDNNIIYRNNSRDYFHLKRERGVHCTVSILENKRIITETVANTETAGDLTSTLPKSIT